MKDLRSFHAKTCIVPDQFLSLQAHSFLVHSPLRGANNGEKEALKPEDCGMKRGPIYGAFRKHLPRASCFHAQMPGRGGGIAEMDKCHPHHRNSQYP